MEGTVKWFNRKKGYGFVNGEDGEEYFVHFTAIKQGTFLRDNDKVSFEAVNGDKGRQAADVVLLQKGSEIMAAEEPAEEPAEEAPVEEPAQEEQPVEEAPVEEPAQEEQPVEEA
ncbi:cold shock domain-containing protein, partial [archaeon]|nr:cold shock domain-containing protein [archaeon]